MSELDLVVAVRDTSDSAALHFMNFVTGLFAFVLASHFVGARLSRTNVAILVGLFSGFSLVSGIAEVARLRLVRSLLAQLSTVPDPQLALPGFFVAPYAPAGIAVLVFVAYLGGVVFLLETRRASGSQPEPLAA